MVSFRENDNYFLAVLVSGPRNAIMREYFRLRDLKRRHGPARIRHCRISKEPKWCAYVIAREYDRNRNRNRYRCDFSRITGHKRPLTVEYDAPDDHSAALIVAAETRGALERELSWQRANDAVMIVYGEISNQPSWLLPDPLRNFKCDAPDELRDEYHCHLSWNGYTHASYEGLVDATVSKVEDKRKYNNGPRKVTVWNRDRYPDRPTTIFQDPEAITRWKRDAAGADPSYHVHECNAPT